MRSTHLMVVVITVVAVSCPAPHDPSMCLRSSISCAVLHGTAAVLWRRKHAYELA